MTSRQIEIKKQSNGIGFSTEYNETDKMLTIKKDEMMLCKFDERGYICKNADIKIPNELKETVEDLRDIAAQVRFYVGLYEKAPQMPFDEIKQYRKLAEFDDVVLGAADMGVNGLLFSTWRVYNDLSGVTLGYYTSSFDSAKEDFATRSKLINEHRLFTKPESENLYKSLKYAITNMETITYEQEKQLKELMDKIIFAYPEIENENPAFDEGQGNEPVMQL